MALRYIEDGLEAGCDEAGRGCLAGPVFASAVILPEGFDCPGLDDSKKLTERQRERLRPFIEEKALAWAVAAVDNRKIDEINILNASILAMHLALEQLVPVPDHIIVDGNRFKPYGRIPYRCIVKGDATYMSIAAASVLAKTHRDEYMRQLDRECPAYNWKKNKGYPTREHRLAIARSGCSIYHRMSFHLLEDQPELPFDDLGEDVRNDSPDLKL